MVYKCKGTEYRKINEGLCDEVRTDQAREEPDEIMDTNHDSKSKSEKGHRHETFELKVSSGIRTRKGRDKTSTPAIPNCLARMTSLLLPRHLRRRSASSRNSRAK
ncbi:hypothetical protein TNCV_3507941 [Trichonephila clavipes]|uniref:Uncharacterized protein n=1 Tax=Trichonephila clavipes TaxID=2585209 RepID=A0A8X6V868_TRICX|nr:hypothetical protein TNCV_3507941 [Trichonephila clavipes]